MKNKPELPEEAEEINPEENMAMETLPEEVNPEAQSARPKIGKNLPLVVLRDAVVFPKLVLPLVIRDKKDVAAIAKAVQGDRLAFFVTALPVKKREGEEETGFKLKPLYLIGIYQHYLTLGHNVVFICFQIRDCRREINHHKRSHGCQMVFF